MESSRIRVAFNGFGSIGQHIFRRLFHYPEIEIAGIQVTNLTKTGKRIEDRIDDLQNNPHYGCWSRELSQHKNNVVVSGREIPFFTNTEFQSRWNELGDIDFLIDCSGMYKNEDKGSLRVASFGAKKTILTGLADEVDATLIYGVNHPSYSSEMNIVSAASCTSMCAATVLDPLSCAFRIKNAFGITVHALTNSQSPHDASLIREYSTGASRGVENILPQLKGKLRFSSVRVPTSQVSYIHFVLNHEDANSSEDVKAVLLEAQKRHRGDILKITDIRLKNKDTNVEYCGYPHSAIVNSAKIRCDRGMIDLYAWYDNEFAYSCRVVDLLRYIAEWEGWLKKEDGTFVDEYVPRPSDGFSEGERDDRE